jgi:hypothetical protein
VHQYFAEQRARHFHGGAGIKRSRENRAEDHCTMLNAKCDCLRDWNCRAMLPETWQS